MADQDAAQGTETSPEVLNEARKMGWIPLEQFRGDQAKWIPAEAYVERGRELMPILRKNNERLQGDLQSLRGQLSELVEAQKAFKEYHTEATKAAYTKALNDLKAEKVEALEGGKFAQVVEIDSALAKLEKTAPQEGGTDPAPKRPDPTQDPAYQAWASEHSEWLGKDADKTAFATSMAQYLRSTNPSLIGRAFLDRVAELTEERYPAPGGKKKEPPADDTSGTGSKVEGGSRGVGQRGARTYANLPREAKEACDRFAEKLVGKGKAYETKDAWQKQYASDYAWE